jgi:hypothetical protein
MLHSAAEKGTGALLPLALCCLVVLVLGTAPALAAPGELEPSFGGDWRGDRDLGSHLDNGLIEPIKL